MRSIMFTLIPLFVAGCFPRTAVVHDGVEATVLDVKTKKPLGGAIVYDRIETNGRPHVLTQSDSSGQLRLDPKTKLTLAHPLGEALVFQTLWVCKDGYEPVRVGGRSGWNADYAPAEHFRPGTLELTPSTISTGESCSDVKW